jgi:hypothetical protein
MDGAVDASRREPGDRRRRAGAEVAGDDRGAGVGDTGAGQHPETGRRPQPDRRLGGAGGTGQQESANPEHQAKNEQRSAAKLAVTGKLDFR